jgi:hypothetical protein
MSPPESALRIVAFADPEAVVWGTAIDTGERAIVFGTAEGAGSEGAGADGAPGSAGEDGPPTRTGSAAGRDAVRFEVRDDHWLLEGDSFELAVTPAEGGPTPTGEELCQVRGSIVVNGERLAVDCPGTRTDETIAIDQLDSLRGVWGWFEGRHALALLALRPRDRDGHESDLVEATLFDPDATIAVEDPRLSTTYTAQGLTSRASLELWIAEGEEQYPRRAAAEALGAGAQVGVSGLSIQVSPMRCHSRGLDGAGVYLLARF